MNWRLPRFPIDEDAPYLHRVIGQTAPLMAWAALLYAISQAAQAAIQVLTYWGAWLRWLASFFLVLLLVTPASATNFWTESWEPVPGTFEGTPNYSVGDSCFHNVGWPKTLAELNLAGQPPFNPILVTTSVGGTFGPFSGTQMCRGHYTEFNNQNASGTAANRFFSAAVPEVWLRYMWRATGLGTDGGQFNYGSFSNKRFWLRHDDGSLQNFWLEHFGPFGGLGFVAQGGPMGTINFPPNIATVNPTDPAHWYCLEAHVFAGTPGSTNGLIEAWIDGTLVTQYTGNTCSNSPVGCMFVPPGGPTDIFSFTQLYIQNGLGEGYFDLVTFGSTRIGGNSYAACTGGGGGSPPNAPTNLIVHGMILLGIAIGLARVAHGSVV